MKKSIFSIVLLCTFLLAGCGAVPGQKSDSDLPTNSDAATVSFVSGMGCDDPNFTDASHRHDCPADCTDYEHHHNCPLDCTEESHHHSGQTAESHHQEEHHGSGHH